jgi:hypothetical protein
VPPHVRKAKKGKKRRVYFTTPPSCPASGAWTTTFIFSYRDGTTDEHSSATPCHVAP